MWVQYQGTRYNTTRDFLTSVAALPDAIVYQCAYDIAYGRDIIGEPSDYPVGDPYRAAWRRRFAAVGISPKQGDASFDRATAISKDIAFPPRDTLTAEDLRVDDAAFVEMCVA